jgi:DNA-binding response OmpR family regulator
MPKSTKAREEAIDKSTTRGARPTTVLVVDDDDRDLRKAAQLLETLGMTVFTARSTVEALQVAGSKRMEVAVVDWLLGERDDGITLGQRLQRDHGVPFILLSRYLDTEATGRAYRLGAADALDKPFRPDRLLAAVRLALGHRQSPTAGVRSTDRGADSVPLRLAKIALKACHSEKDPNTETAVADAAGISTSVFQRDCHACGVKPSSLRDLIRLLWANAMAGRDDSTLRSHIGSLDPRTVKRLFQRSGLPIDARFMALRTFFFTQRLIPTTTECLRELVHVAANDPMFFVELVDDKTGTEDR